MNDIICNSDKSEFVMHILDIQHSFGMIADTVVIRIMPKGHLMDTWEQY